MPAKPLPPELIDALRNYVARPSGARSLWRMGSPDNRDWPSEWALHQAKAGRPVSDATRAHIESGLRKHAPHLIGAEGPDVLPALRGMAAEWGFDLPDEGLLRAYENVLPYLKYNMSQAL